MNDVRIDRGGQLRCWNCGATHMARRRTGTFWLAVIIGGVLTIGVFSLLALVFVKPKLQCQVCNQWNRPGQAQTYTGPARDVPPPPARQPDLQLRGYIEQANTSRPQGDHLPTRKTQGG